jgi:hypothetical protein
VLSLHHALSLHGTLRTPQVKAQTEDVARLAAEADQHDSETEAAEEAAQAARDAQAQAVQAQRQPMNEQELQQTVVVIQQLWRLIINTQEDVRQNYDIQHLLHVCLGLLPRLQASAEIGPFNTSFELTDLAEQCLYDMEEVIALYNDEALLYQLGDSGFAADVGLYQDSMYGYYEGYDMIFADDQTTAFM